MAVPGNGSHSVSAAAVRPRPIRRGVRALDAAARRVGNAARFVLRKLLWVLFRVLRLAWRHPALTLLIALAGYVGYQQALPYLFPPPVPAAAPPVQAAPLVQPPESVTQYLEGQRKFDAEAMWNAFSEETKAAHLAEGSSLSTFKRAIQRMQDSGLEYGESVYIGGFVLPSGLSYYFYVTEVGNAAGQRAQVYQIFVIDREGKVIEVDTPQLEP
jgi:hypothetical protein